MAESPLKPGLIWTGSDDGLVNLTQDGGKHWANVTPKGLPEWMRINTIEASPFDAGTAYFAGTKYQLDDFQPYLYKTTDYGKTWTAINSGIGPRAFTRTIREDPNHRNLLVAGTETGMYVSFNGGDKWQSFQLNLPVVPITDLAFQKREKELVVATQGRAFWIFDDLPLLYQLAVRPARGRRQVISTERSLSLATRRIPPAARWVARPESGIGSRGLLFIQGQTEGRSHARVSGRFRQVDSQVFEVKPQRPEPAGAEDEEEGVSASSGRAPTACPPRRVLIDLSGICAIPMRPRFLA